MHVKTDSEVTSSSLAASSPDNNRRAAYYVQSPARDSHDGGKTTTSFHSTPVISPAGSPPRSSVGNHSRESSTSRFYGSRKVNPNDAGSGGNRGAGAGGRQQPWNHKEVDVIEEEGLLDDEDSKKPLPRFCYFLMFVLGFFVLFTIFSLILLGVSKSQKPIISMTSLRINRLMVQAGSDDSGVSTDMISLNSTVRFDFANTGTFFGVRVGSTPVDIYFSDLVIGSGTIKEFYQRRKSRRPVVVSVIGDMIPLYGSGASLSTQNGTTAAPVPLKLDFTVKSRAYVLGKLVKPRFHRRVQCRFTLEPKKMNDPISLKNACTVV